MREVTFGMTKGLISPEGVRRAFGRRRGKGVYVNKGYSWGVSLTCIFGPRYAQSRDEL